ncbi:MAG: 4Fe-4S binding protein [Nitrososphaerota archaeon]|nr:4Fe-4S binding protein [Nitrososphaerota archaeon]MDG6932782.1 4Fe-4S binding protein [Nitrososphaerota archaeon]MDG6936543.1 4Fe-4S binding protein [Nitrososphaerota archaeon]MDG6944856.1 4Fe-4S binding protein [Nitrososphaerota archaeon]
MSMYASEQRAFVKRRVDIFDHHCMHRHGTNETCDPQELSKRLSDKEAVVIVGIYDDDHLKVYREAVARAGLNQMLVEVIDYRWSKGTLENAVAALQANWVAELAPEIEGTIQYTRRDIITGHVKVYTERSNKPVFIAGACGDLYRVCDTCQQSCPKGAITVDKKTGVSINEGACDACGLCASSCPTGALQMPKYPDSSFVAIGEVKGSKVISCYKHRGESIKVPCVAELNAVDVLAMRAGGQVTVLCPDMSCPSFSNLKRLQGDINNLEKIYGGIRLVTGETESTEATNEVPIEAPLKYERYEIFKGLVNETNAGALGTLDVSVNGESCTLCENCAKYCPTEALTIEREQEKTLLRFNPEHCIGCRVCTNVCPENGAITVDEFKGKFGVRTVAQDEIVKCRVCGALVGNRKSLLKVKKTLESKGIPVDDGWLERCPQHRFTYTVTHMGSITFKPRVNK